MAVSTPTRAEMQAYCGECKPCIRRAHHQRFMDNLRISAAEQRLIALRYPMPPCERAV